MIKGEIQKYMMMFIAKIIKDNQGPEEGEYGIKP